MGRIASRYRCALCPVVCASTLLGCTCPAHPPNICAHLPLPNCVHPLLLPCLQARRLLPAGPAAHGSPAAHGAANGWASHRRARQRPGSGHCGVSYLLVCQALHCCVAVDLQGLRLACPPSTVQDRCCAAGPCSHSFSALPSIMHCCCLPETVAGSPKFGAVPSPAGMMCCAAQWCTCPPRPAARRPQRRSQTHLWTRQQLLLRRP